MIFAKMTKSTMKNQNIIKKETKNCKIQRSTNLNKLNITNTLIIVLISIITSCCLIQKVHSAPTSSSDAEKLCGAKLVDALRFLCGERGIYTPAVSGVGPMSRYRTPIRRPPADITVVCCQRGCTYKQLELYCGEKVPQTEQARQLSRYRKLRNLLPYGRRRYRKLRRRF